MDDDLYYEDDYFDENEPDDVSFCSSFDYIDNGRVSEMRWQGCMESCFTQLPEHDQFRFYVLKDYTKIDNLWDYQAGYKTSDSNQAINPEEMKEFISILKNMGFTFEVEENATCHVPGQTAARGVDCEAYAFTLETRTLPQLHARVLVHWLRAMYEHDLPEAVLLFLKWAREQSDIPMFDRLNMAMCAKNYRNYGHMYKQYYGMPLPYTQEDFEKLVLKGNGSGRDYRNTQSDIRHTREVNAEELQAWQTVAKTESVDKVYEGYLKLLETKKSTKKVRI